jgi:hypothetical protein
VNISLIRAALAAQVGLYAYPALRMLAEPEDQINPPVGMVLPGTPYATYSTTLTGATGFGGFIGGGPASAPMSPTDFMLDIMLVVSHASTLERVEQNLDAWLGMESDGTAVSVPAAVLRDPTLGGTVSWCEPTTAERPGPLSYNGVEMFGTRIHFSCSAM